MNGKIAKKIRKVMNEKETEMVKQVLDYFNPLSFFKRVKIAWKIIRRKLQEQTK